MILSRRPSSDQPAQPMENTELLILKNPTSLDKIVQSLQYVLYPNMLLQWEDSGMNSVTSHMQKFVASNLSQSLTSFQSLHGRKPEKCWKTTAYLPNNYPPTQYGHFTSFTHSEFPCPSRKHWRLLERTSAPAQSCLQQAAQTIPHTFLSISTDGDFTKYLPVSDHPKRKTVFLLSR